MSKYYYAVYDSLGNFMRGFQDYKHASIYQFTYGNNGWRIECYTIKQR